MDILRLYRARPRSPQLEQEAERAYAHLQQQRIRAAKLVLPAALLVAATSIRTRPALQIARNFVAMAAGGMAVNELSAWNSLAAKLYLLLREDDNQ